MHTQNHITLKKNDVMSLLQPFIACYCTATVNAVVTVTLEFSNIAVHKFIQIQYVNGLHDLRMGLMGYT